MSLRLSIDDITGQNPLSGPLRNNDGLTRTHALLFGSPVIDAGYPFSTRPGSAHRRTL